ncbi:MAG: site-specific integrase [Deferrisomatales bacterium]|nr:site-specific integrase [Deferrisomatales bacterium]
MAVYRRRVCACGTEVRDAVLHKVLPPCASCGSPTRYLGKWYVSVLVRAPKGTRRLTRAVSARKDEAQAEERRLLGARDQGAVVRAAEQTSWQHAAATFLAWVDAQEAKGKLAAGSARSYRYRLSVHLEPHFCGEDIQRIDHDAADAYVEGRQSSNASPATINRELATLKRLLTVAVKARLIGSNPLLGYELLAENNARDIHLTGEQVTSLLAACAKEHHPKHLYPIVLLALHTGLRREGCLTLRWEEIDWTRGEIIKAVKGKTVVRIPMTPTLRQELEAWRIRDGLVRARGWVFPSPATGAAMLVTSKFGFETAMREIGMPRFHFHDLRHTFATLFLEQFPDQIETLRDILGHSGVYMTRRYAHITDRSRHAAMAKFEIGG